MTSDPKVKTENRIVCFIDILGYSEIIREFERSQDISIIEKIQRAFKASMDNISSQDSSLVSKEKIEAFRKRVLFKTFSDNVIIAITYTEASFFLVAEVVLTFSNVFQNSMLQQGVYTRGGVAHGPFYFDENIIFSGALVTAYEIENKIALYPRIVIHKSTIDKIRAYGKEQVEESHLGKLIYFDWEGNAFINPITMGDYTYFDTLKEYLDAPELFSEEFKSTMTDDKISLIKNAIKLQSEQTVKIADEIESKANSGDYPERVRNKYQWLLQFYRWRYSKESTLINFIQLKDTERT